MRKAGVILILLGVLTIKASASLGFTIIAIGSVLLFARHKKKPTISVSMSFTPTNVDSKTKKKRARNLPKIGNVEAICPHCNQSLEKKSGRKKKCPNCGEYIYVRTRPIDNQKVLVTQDQTEIIEEQWAIVYGTHKEYIAQRENTKRTIEKERQTLEKRFGQKPSDNDIQWSLLNNDILKHAQHRDWGLFRNTKFNMAEILRKETKLKSALSFYLEVCYLDLNGPNNVGGISSSELLKEYPAWNPKDAFLAPGIISRVLKIIKKIEFDRSSSREFFLSKAIRLEKSLRLPVSPQKAWKELEKELFED